MIRFAFSLAMAFIIALSSQAQQYYRINTYTVADGLSNNTVRDLHQDRLGFMWMATTNGLNKFDGYSFSQFRPERHNADSGDKTPQRLSLSDIRVRIILEDQNGLLWIQTTSNHLSCYNPLSGAFVDYLGEENRTRTFTTIYITGKETWLWGEEKGCIRCGLKDGEIYSRELLGKDKENRQVSFVCGDSTEVFIGTDKGLWHYKNNKLTQTEPVSQFMAGNFYGSQSAFLTTTGKIYCHNGKKLDFIGEISPDFDISDYLYNFFFRGSWYIVTRKSTYKIDLSRKAVVKPEDGLFLPNSEMLYDNYGDIWIHNNTGILTRVSNKESKTEKINLAEGNVIQPMSEQYDICHGSDGKIWIGTNGIGLFCYYPESGRLEHFTSSPISQIILPSNTVKSVMEDREGNIWIGQEYTGVSIIEQVDNSWANFIYPFPADEEYTNANFIRLLYYNDGTLSVSNRRGDLMEYSNDMDMVSTSQYKGNVYCMNKDLKGRTWTGTKGGGLYVDGKRYTYNPADKASLPSNDIYSILRDKSGRMWIATFGMGVALAEETNGDSIKFRNFLNRGDRKSVV